MQLMFSLVSQSALAWPTDAIPVLKEEVLAWCLLQARSKQCDNLVPQGSSTCKGITTRCEDLFVMQAGLCTCKAFRLVLSP